MNPNYYYFVRVIGRRNFLLRVKVSDDTLSDATKMAECYLDSPNFKIEEATLENIFGFEHNVVDLVPMIITFNKEKQ